MTMNALKLLSKNKFMFSHSSYTCGHRATYNNNSSTATYSSVMPRAKYGGRHTIALLPGDGIGPQMMDHVKDVLKAAECPIDFEIVAVNRYSNEDEMENAILAIKRNGVALKGNLESLSDGSNQQMSKNLTIRTRLDLFAYVQRCKNLPGIDTRHKNVDIYIIRENTEGEYSSLEHENVPGVVESLKIITEVKSKRIAKYAFDFALRHNRKKVTAVHKANIMKLADGLFLHTCAEVAKLYPQIEFESMIIDNCCMQLVANPQQFDVMVMPNLYGNIVGNIGAALVGGPGICSGKNIGSNHVLFETGTRNSGRALIGKNKANPCAMLFAAADMVEHIGLLDRAHIIKRSIVRVIGEKGMRTQDLGGNCSSTDVVQNILKDIKESI